eukprot:gb/GECG01013338.1/.p1 GENE.gb/GECG01013338.1/~~gb/GECG01013338.1/.p1  ORF type:complete len:126 (+),score=11.46 gb/GECG01013338.1/:1-378(+)
MCGTLNSLLMVRSQTALNKRKFRGKCSSELDTGGMPLRARRCISGVFTGVENTDIAFVSVSRFSCNAQRQIASPVQTVYPASTNSAVTEPSTFKATGSDVEMQTITNPMNSGAAIVPQEATSKNK